MPPTPKLKRIFTGITLSTNEVRDIAHHAAAAGRLDIRANGARLMDVGQVDQVISEDVVLDRLTILAIDGESALEFSYEPSHILLRADEDAPRLREPFAVIAGLLTAKPPNGFGRCSIDVSMPGTWQVPSLPPSRVEPVPARARSSRRSAGLLARWWRRLPFARRRAARR